MRYPHTKFKYYIFIDVSSSVAASSRFKTNSIGFIFLIKPAGTAQLDTTRIGRDVQKLMEEVVNHLTSVDGAQVELSLELNVTSTNGFSQQTVRTVSENCQTLKLRAFGFEE